MKVKVSIASIVALVLCASTITYAQISGGGHPYSFAHSVPSAIEVKTMPKVDVEALLREDETAQKDQPYRFGYGFDVSYTLENSGTWLDLPDGSKLWRLCISSPGAYSINLIYDKFWLPAGARLFVYNQERSMAIGAFTARNNKLDGKFATELVKGDAIILEYHEPANVTGPGEISVSRIVHAYRDFFDIGQSGRSLSKTLGFGHSGWCNNNVYCPEATGWEDEVHSVARIVGGGSAASGALLNNVEENYAPYFLTAEHVYDNLPSPSTWIFYFNYESESCTNPGEEPTSQTITGASHKASNTASDFALMMLSETPPLDYGVYYAGWSNTGTALWSSVCIHHPSADIKKISYEDDYAPTTGYCWEVVWDDGVTEPGSSGSPLFDPYHRVVGQLYGGTSSCATPNGPDFFGKFSVSWDYGASPSTRLKDWLDPDNFGVTVFNGIEGGMLSAGEIPASATWSGTHALTGNVTVPSGVSLTILAGTTITMNGHYLKSTGGTIIDNGATWNPNIKNENGYYATIQSAINDAALYGYPTTVDVGPGTYNEQVVMKEDVDLWAVDHGCPGNTVIDVGLGYTTAVSFNGIANARVRGFTLRGYAAVYCSDRLFSRLLWQCHLGLHS